MRLMPLCPHQKKQQQKRGIQCDTKISTYTEAYFASQNACLQKTNSRSLVYGSEVPIYFVLWRLENLPDVTYTLRTIYLSSCRNVFT